VALRKIPPKKKGKREKGQKDNGTGKRNKVGRVKKILREQAIPPRRREKKGKGLQGPKTQFKKKGKGLFSQKPVWGGVPYIKRKRKLELREKKKPFGRVSVEPLPGRLKKEGGKNSPLVKSGLF